MASYDVKAEALGAYEKTLVANTVDKVSFVDDLSFVEVFSDGAAAIYLTVDGSAPTVHGEDCYFLPATASVRKIEAGRGQATVVQLISAGTPTYSVAKAVA